MSRHSIPSDLEAIVRTSRPAFSKRSWPYLLAIVAPWILCAGQRCVTRLFTLGGHRRSLSGYYRFLSDGKIRIEALFRLLFDLILRTFPTPSLLLVVDDTLVPKWGRGIFGTGTHFDHVKRPRAGFIWGHDWVVLAMVVQVGATAWVAVPFWITLYRPKKVVRGKREFRTRLELTVEALQAVRTWFTGPILLLADGAYNNASMIVPMRALGIELVSRLRNDARLRKPEVARRPKGTRGRKPKHGPLLPSLKKLASSRSAFRKVKAAIYGKTVTLLVREIEAFWEPINAVVKIVITKDPNNSRRIAYLMTTDLTMAATAVIEAFGHRWCVEQLFSTMKLQLGFGSAEVRTERSVRRHAALTVAIATWIEVWARGKGATLRARSFSTKLAALRQDIVTKSIFEATPRTMRSRRIARGVASLFSAATSAA
ncbi:MAG: transposase [Dehalococcoidia bacterium]